MRKEREKGEKEKVNFEYKIFLHARELTPSRRHALAARHDNSRVSHFSKKNFYMVTTLHP